MAKLRVAVFFGGCSDEHEISLMSAASVIRNLDRSLYDVICISIDKSGGFHHQDCQSLLDDPEMDLTVDQSLPLLSLDSRSAKKLFDVAMPILHGAIYEDGIFQGFLQALNVPYVGAGVLGSAIGMDKDISSRLAAYAGIAVTPFESFISADWQQQYESYKALIEEKLEFPVFVKPVDAGSSVGITKVKQSDDLFQAFEKAFERDCKVVVEQGVDAREIEVAVLESDEYGQPPLVSIPGEVIPHGEYYSYEAKYFDPEGASLDMPAKLSDELVAEVQALAAKVFTVLGCESMARVDFFLDKQTNQLYFNELNTLPGFTDSISLYPKLWALSGVPYQQLLTHLINLALARYDRQTKIKREVESS